MFFFVILVWKIVSTENGLYLDLKYLSSPTISVMTFRQPDLTFKFLTDSCLGEMAYVACERREVKGVKNQKILSASNPDDYVLYAIMGKSTNDISGEPVLVLWEMSHEGKKRISPHREDFSEVQVKRMVAKGSFLLAKRLEYEYPRRQPFKLKRKGLK